MAALAVACYGSILGSLFPVMTVMTIGDIGGGLSVAADSAALVSTCNNIGNVAGILATPAFAFGMGRGRTMASFGTGFLLTSVAAAMAPTLGWMLVTRFVHGFFGGALPLLMMLLVMTSLKPGEGRFEGMTLFAASTTIFFGLAALLGGWVVDMFGWRGLFWVQAIAIFPYCVAARRVLANERGNIDQFKNYDWASYFLVTLGLSAILLALSEGERHFWLEAWWVPALLIGGSITTAFAGWTLPNAQRPLLVLEVFRRATFSWSIALSLFFRFGSLFAILIVPQYLTRIQGYRPREIGELLSIMIPATIAALIIAYYMSKRFDGRLLLTAGLSLFGVACFLCTGISSEWAADELYSATISAGLGMGFFQVAVLRYAVQGVSLRDGPTVGVVFNLARVFGLVGGISILSHLLIEREKFHSAGIAENLHATDPETAARLSSMTANFVRFSSDLASSQNAATTTLAQAASGQAFTMGFSDTFLITAIVLLVGSILVWVLPSLPPEVTTPSVPTIPSSNSTE